MIPSLGAAESYGLEVGQLAQTRSAQIFECKKYEQMMDVWLTEAGQDYKNDFVAQQLIMQCIEKKIEVLVVLALSPIGGFHLTVLRNIGIKLVHWFYEDARLVEYWKDLAPAYDLWCGIQKGEVPNWISGAGGNYKYLAMAPSLRFQKACEARSFLTSTESSDIGFIGVPTKARVEILERLQRLGYSLALGGEGWSNVTGALKSSVFIPDWASPEQSVELYKSCKVLLNLNAMGFANGTSEYDYESQISPRVFELALMGKPVISQNLAAHKGDLENMGCLLFSNELELELCVKSALSGLRESVQDSKYYVLREHHFETRLDCLENWVFELG